MSCVLIMAGGTGGHVFPALAVAHELQRKNISVVWLGTKRGIESSIVPANTIPVEWITIHGLRGKGLLSWLLAPFKLLQAMLQSYRAIRKVKPNCVLGMGGFVAGPGGLVARLCAKPLLIHEQNAVAGLTNYWLAKIAQRVFTGFDNVPNLPARAKWVGNPVREKIKTVAKGQSDNKLSNELNLLIIGGSQGAHSFNEYLPAILSSLDDKVRIWHQTGKGRADAVQSTYQQLTETADAKIKVTEFIDDMATAYQWADLLVCRAGAMTVAECCAAGVPAIFVPYPYSAGDHQVANAECMVMADAAMMIANSELTTSVFTDALTNMLSDKARLAEMGRNAEKLHKQDSASLVAEACEEYCYA